MDLLVTPTGMYHENQKVFPSHLHCPVCLFLEGFPLQFTHHHLQGLSYGEKKEYTRTQKHWHGQKENYVFSRRGLLAHEWVVCPIKKHDIERFLGPLEEKGIAIQGIRLQVFEDARFLNEPTLHIKKLPDGTTRLLYAFKGLPYVVRYIPSMRLAKETQDTLAYIHHTYDHGTVTIDQRTFPIKASFFTRYPGYNRFWVTYQWGLASLFLALFLALATWGGGFLLHQKYAAEKERIALWSSLEPALEKRILHFPHQACDQLYKGLKIHPHRPTHNWHEVYMKLLGLDFKGLLQKVQWVPQGLHLTFSFEHGLDAETCQKKLETLWPWRKVQRTLIHDTEQGIDVTWHLLG